MSRLKVCLPALLALSLALPAMAAAQANVSGPWEVTIDSPQGPMSIDADLKQDGEALTGMITSPMGNVELKGTFKNDELAFSYSVPLQGQNLDITMTGKLAGDTIDVWDGDLEGDTLRGRYRKSGVGAVFVRVP